jgi:hypothetical protein
MAAEAVVRVGDTSAFEHSEGLAYVPDTCDMNRPDLSL